MHVALDLKTNVAVSFLKILDLLPGQNYGVGKYFFSKYSFPGDFISCKSPLLKEPPRNVATLFNHMIEAWEGKRREFKNQVVLRRMTFAVCQMIKSMNEAAVYYKEQHCASSTANYNRTLAFFDNMESVLN